MRAIAYFKIDPGNIIGPSADLESFTRAFENYCSSRNHLPQGVFAEDSIENDSPKYIEMVTMIRESGLGFLVVVPATSHLGSSIVIQTDRILELDSLSCQVVCDDDDFPDPFQNGLKTMNAGIGSRRERILEGMRAKATRALGLGKPPFGYRIDFEGFFKLVPEEADVVRLMFRMYLDEKIGVRTIANRLNQRRIRTRRGARWSMVTVRDVLRNHSYIGTYQRFGLRIPASYEPIVSADEFKEVQDIMLSRSSGRPKQKNAPFLLAGILYCGYCGQRMVGVTRNQSWQVKEGGRASSSYRYYQCQTRINRNQCKYRTTKADNLEEAVLVALRTKDPVMVTCIPGDPASLSDQRVQLSNLLDGVDKRYVEFIQRTAVGTLSLYQLRSIRQEIITYRREIQERLENTIDNPDGLRAMLANCWAKLDSHWEDLDIHERRDTMSTLVAKIEVRNGKVQISARI